MVSILLCQNVLIVALLAYNKWRLIYCCTRSIPSVGDADLKGTFSLHLIAGVIADSQGKKAQSFAEVQSSHDFYPEPAYLSLSLLETIQH